MLAWNNSGAFLQKPGITGGAAEPSPKEGHPKGRNQSVGAGKLHGTLPAYCIFRPIPDDISVIRCPTVARPTSPNWLSNKRLPIARPFISRLQAMGAYRPL